MTATALPTRYGAAEIKVAIPKNWWKGLAISIVIHALIIGSYYLIDSMQGEEPPKMMVRIMKYSDIGPPPSIAQTNLPPPIAVSAPTAKPTVGSPVPVPDAEVSPEQTIPTQQEMSQATAPVTEGAVGSNVVVQQDIKIDDDAPPADFVAVEKEPIAVKKIEPKYPELAVRAGLEGTVWVKLWVDKGGKVKQVVVLKCDVEVFSAPTIEAAKQWAFTPAYMNNGPVSVWVSVPFRFKLNSRN